MSDPKPLSDEQIEELLGKVQAHVQLGASISGVTRREALIALDSVRSARSRREATAPRSEADEATLREALQGFLDVFWPTAEEGHTGFVDRLGMQFYRETGVWPHFKSAPLDVAASLPPPEETQKKWRAWLDAKRDAAAAAAVAALSGGTDR